MMRHHGMHHAFEQDGSQERGRRGGFGPGDGPGGFGPGGGRHHGSPHHGPRGGRRGGRARGDVRVAILVLLAEQPRHGYDLMRAIEERTDGAWSPSAGSIYPTLQALEDEGLVEVATVDGRRTASLTDEGRAWHEEHAEEASSIFVSGDTAPGAASIRKEMMALGEAALHVARQSTGTDLAQEAARIIGGARKELYRLLAEREE